MFLSKTSRRGLSLRGMGRAALQVLLPPLFVVVMLTSGAVAGEALSESSERSRFPAPGHQVDIGNGQLMHVREWGARVEGEPTLILLAGAAIPSSAWGWIGPALAEGYHVVAVDRPGMGWSFGGSGPRTSKVAADAMTAAFDKMGIGPPYVVIAHSFAGFAARVFIGEHRSDVAAAVLLDTSTPQAPGSGYGFFYRLDALKGHLGVPYLDQSPNSYGSLPSPDAAAAYAVSRWTSHMDASADELDVWDVSAQEVRDAGDLGSLPLLVVTTTGAAANQLEWQRQVAALSTSSQFVVLDVGHTQMLTEPQQAQLVVAQVRDFLSAALP